MRPPKIPIREPVEPRRPGELSQRAVLLLLRRYSLYAYLEAVEAELQRLLEHGRPAEIDLRVLVWDIADLVRAAFYQSDPLFFPYDYARVDREDITVTGTRAEIRDIRLRRDGKWFRVSDLERELREEAQND